MTNKYTEGWGEIVKILAECPSEKKIAEMLTAVGFDLSEFEKRYGEKCIEDGMLWGKDLKDRYSVLWLYFDLYGGLANI